MRSLTLTMLLSCLGGSASAAQNLFQDPGFLQPPTPPGTFVNYNPGQMIGPWTVVGNGNVVTESNTYSSRGFLFDAKSGSAFMDLTGLCDCGAKSGVAQTVATTPGATYKLSFWVGNTYIPGAGTTSTVNVYVGSTLLLSAVNSQGEGIPKQVWQQFATTFVATQNSTTISFYNGDPGGDVNNGLDDVKLVPAGPPDFATLFSFDGASDGSTPNGGLALASTGQFYGTTYGGGTDDAGTVFSFAPNIRQLTTLYQFTGHTDGAQPGLRPAIGSDGSIYGATQYGGTANSGTVFKLVPGTGQLTTLYSFQALSDGAEPGGALLIDSSGYLDGTAHAGGAYNFGDLFQINPTSLTEKTLFSFRGGGGGNAPGVITFNSLRVIYGATSKGGGSSNAGILYSFNPATAKLRTLYKFSGGADGSSPAGGFAFDNSGNFYGTTLTGGSGDAGTIFEYSPATSRLTTLYSFTGGADGSGPRGGMIMDASGNLYGTTVKTNGATGTGSLFRFNPATAQLVTLHSFTGGADGGTPNPDPVFDDTGAVYGTTSLGGSAGFGTIFKYTP